jgi:hypothetical protein
MQVAIFSGGNLVGRHIERGLGCLSRTQPSAIKTSVRSDDLNPFDEVFLFHGMRDFADFDLKPVGKFLNDRHMFFQGRIHGVFVQKDHGLAAAYQFAGTFMKHFDDITAFLAFIYFSYTRHFDLLF